MPSVVLPAGIKKRCRNGFLQAVAKQVSGIVIRPTIKRIELRSLHREAAEVLNAKRMLIRPRPKNAMWPNRTIRRGNES